MKPVVTFTVASVVAILAVGCNAESLGGSVGAGDSGVSSGQPTGELRMASFNIRHLGWDNEKSFEALARVAGSFDWIAIQEVMDEDAVYQLSTELAAITGANWSARISEAQGRGSYKEHYAYLYRDNQFEHVGPGRVYPDAKDDLARPPYSVAFTPVGSAPSFVATTTHVLYGDSISDRVPEIEILGSAHWEWLEDTYAGEDSFILLGDFNLAPDHAAFDDIEAAYDRLAISGRTTLSSIDNRFANPYDHIFLSETHDFNVTGFGVLDFPELLSDSDPDRYWSHEAARDYVSDHAPVYFFAGGASALYSVDEGSLFVSDWAYGSQGGSADNDDGTSCVAINSPSAEQLQELPGIGPTYAQRIIDQRPFTSVGALRDVSGIGAKTVANIEASGLLCDEGVE